LTRALVLALAWVVPLHGAAAQARNDSLSTVVEQARVAWLGQKVRALVAHSDTVRLRLPGVAASASTRPSQAARLLEEYLSAATERDLTLREVRYVQADHAYAEFSRRFAVRGTDDLREETIFLGFRRVDGSWRLREVRVAP
jgi:hypothetical protein